MSKSKKDESNGLPPGYESAVRSSIEKWVEGMELEGVFLAMEQSSNPGYSPILKLREKSTGKVRKFGCPADLQYRLESVAQNAEVFIRCNGMMRGKRGKEEWSFSVGFVPTTGNVA